MHSPSLMLPHGKCEEGGRGGGGNYAQPLTDAPSRDPPAEPGAVPLPPDRSLQWWAAAGRERARSPTYWPGMRGDGGGHHLKGASTGSPKALLLPDPASCPPPLLPFPCLSPPPPPPPGSTSHRAEASSWTAAPPGHSASVSGLRSGWRVEGSSTCCRMGDVEAPPPPLPALSLPSPPPPSAPHPCPLPLQASGRGPWPWWGRSRCCSAAPSGRTSPTGSGEKRRRR